MTSAGQYIPNYAVTASGGPYRWQAVDAYAQTVYTNGPKAGQYRGFGTAQACFATECALDELCRAAWRRTRWSSGCRTGCSTARPRSWATRWPSRWASGRCWRRCGRITRRCCRDASGSPDKPGFSPWRGHRRHVVPVRQVRLAADRGARGAGKRRPVHHLLHRGRLRAGHEYDDGCRWPRRRSASAGMQSSSSTRTRRGPRTAASRARRGRPISSAARWSEPRTNLLRRSAGRRSRDCSTGRPRRSRSQAETWFRRTGCDLPLAEVAAEFDRLGKSRRTARHLRPIRAVSRPRPSRSTRRSSSPARTWPRWR